MDPSIFNEPACDHNRTKSAKEKKAGCPKPKAGAAVGGCAFDGAMIALVPLTDVAHVVHGPSACLGNSWDERGSLSSGPDLYRRGLTSDVSEHDVIFGGEQKLYDTVLEVVEKFSPPAIFVYSTCVVATIGDDIEAVCRAAQAATSTPVVPVISPGFAGSKNLGNRLAGAAMLDYVIGTVEPETVTPLDVTLVGEYNIAGDMWDITPVLARLGIRVAASISGDGRYADAAAAHRTRATMVVCSHALLGLARGMQEKYGIPYFEGSFFGIRAMSDAIRDFAKILDDGSGELIARAEEVIADEEATVNAALEPYRQRLRGTKAVLYTGGNKSWSLVSALKDCGVEVVVASTKKSTEDGAERIAERMEPGGKVIADATPAQLLALVEESGADMLLAGSRNQFNAMKGVVPFLDVNQERQIAYGGYKGVIELARQVELTISSPVWDIVRAPAPWDLRTPSAVAPMARVV